MSAMLPVAVYSLVVPPGDIAIPALANFAATFRITMAAIDPTEEPEDDEGTTGPVKARSTLKMIYDRNPSMSDDEDDEDSEDEDDYLQRLLDGVESDGLSDEDDDDEEDEEGDEEVNGGPSDPARSKKARKEAAAKQIMAALAEGADGELDDEDDDDMDVDPALIKTSAGKKGKGKAAVNGADEEESDSGVSADFDDDDSDDAPEEVVICTLDAEKTCQQTIDITVPEDQATYFLVSGNCTVHLTGNYVVPAVDEHDHSDDEDEDEDYDLSPDEDELLLGDEDESDELDDLEDPRVTEVDSDDDAEVPQLVKKPSQTSTAKKGKNKRAAASSDDEDNNAASLDDLMAKSIKSDKAETNGETKLSKKQQKKLKNNAGKPVEVAADSKDAKKDDTTSKSDKKVQFAKNIEQGPTPSAPKTDDKKGAEKGKASLGVKMVQGVKVDDKKLGSGPAAKKGDKLGMRYIGKLSDGKVFDANKKGPPFRFKLGVGQVIKGWEVGVAGMSVGGERRITVPASMGYGSKGTAGIPGNSELTFDIKLLEIN